MLFGFPDHGNRPIDIKLGRNLEGHIVGDIKLSKVTSLDLKWSYPLVGTFIETFNRPWRKGMVRLRSNFAHT